MNHISMNATLVRDPDYRENQSGAGWCALRLADNKRYTGKDGQSKEKTLFINAKSYNKTATLCHQFLSKGSKVFVSGSVESDEYTTKDGQKRTDIFIRVEQIEFLSAPAEQQAPRHDRNTGYAPRSVDPQYAPKLNDGERYSVEDTPF